jgi:hypothetical protein
VLVSKSMRRFFTRMPKGTIILKRKAISSGIELCYLNLFDLRFITESLRELEDAPQIDGVVQMLKDWVKNIAGMCIIESITVF